jgi:hypothetical protein
MHTKCLVHYRLLTINPISLLLPAHSELHASTGTPIMAAMTPQFKQEIQQVGLWETCAI